MHPRQRYVRTSPRVPLKLDVDWSVDGSVLHFVSHTKDLSDRGIFIGSLSAGPIGARVRMRIPMGGGDLELEGTVVRRDQRGMGVSLDRTTDRLREVLATM